MEIQAEQFYNPMPMSAAIVFGFCMGIGTVALTMQFIPAASGAGHISQSPQHPSRVEESATRDAQGITPALTRAGSTLPGAMTAARPAIRCGECGVVESIREIQHQYAGASSDPAMQRSHELTVRMKDGRVRVLSDLSASSWRIGEQVVLIF